MKKKVDINIANDILENMELYKWLEGHDGPPFTDEEGDALFG